MFNVKYGYEILGVKSRVYLGTRPSVVKVKACQMGVGATCDNKLVQRHIEITRKRLISGRGETMRT